jgi:hypothetical protein
MSGRPWLVIVGALILSGAAVTVSSWRRLERDVSRTTLGPLPGAKGQYELLAARAGTYLLDLEYRGTSDWQAVHPSGVAVVELTPAGSSGPPRRLRVPIGGQASFFNVEMFGWELSRFRSRAGERWRIQVTLQGGPARGGEARLLVAQRDPEEATMEYLALVLKVLTCAILLGWVAWRLFRRRLLQSPA